MGTILTIAGKELKSFFLSWIAYVLAFFYLGIAGLMMYAIINASAQDVHIEWLYHNMLVTMLFVVPIITMRLFAEEKATGTIELLLTAPVTDFQVVMGKFLGATALVFTMFLVALVFPILVGFYGGTNWPLVWSSNIGMLLVAMGCIAIGLLVSSVTESTVVAGFMAFGALLLFWIVGWLGQDTTTVTGEVLNYLSISSHFESFPRGILSLKDTVYYASFIVLFLFFTVRSVESRKWR